MQETFSVDGRCSDGIDRLADVLAVVLPMSGFCFDALMDGLGVEVEGEIKGHHGACGGQSQEGVSEMSSGGSALRCGAGQSNTTIDAPC